MLTATALPVQTWTPQLGAVRVNEGARLVGNGVRLFERSGSEPVRLQWISSVEEGETTVLR
jgi:hypothetical protein